MSDLQPYRPSGGLSAITWGTTGRALSRLEQQHLIRTARVRSEALVQEEKIEAVCGLGQRAQQGVALMTQLEQQLSQLVPMSASRLQAIGDLTTLSVSEVVADAVRQVRRS
jgi:hypothetical protein